MSTPLTEVDLPGIGARRIQRLVDAGYHTVHQLAAVDPAATHVEGIPGAVLRGAVHAARDLADAEPSGEVVPYPAEGPPDHEDPPPGSEADVVRLPTATEDPSAAAPRVASASPEAASETPEASSASPEAASPTPTARADRSARVRSRAIALDEGVKSARRVLEEAGHRRARKARKELARVRKELDKLARRARSRGLGEKRTARAERLLDNLESALARFAEDGPTKKGARRLRKVARKVRKTLN